MDGTWTLSRTNKRDLDKLVVQLNELLKGHNLTIVKLETAPFITRPRPDSSWDRLQDDVQIKKGSDPRLLIPAKGWIGVPLKPFKHKGKTYRAEITIRGDSVTVYLPHLQGDPEVVAETHYTITATDR